MHPSLSFEMRSVCSLAQSICLFGIHAQNPSKHGNAIGMICVFRGHQEKATRLFEPFLFWPWPQGLLENLNLNNREPVNPK